MHEFAYLVKCAQLQKRKIHASMREYLSLMHLSNLGFCALLKIEQPPHAMQLNSNENRAFQEQKNLHAKCLHALGVAPFLNLKHACCVQMPYTTRCLYLIRHPIPLNRGNQSYTWHKKAGMDLPLYSIVEGESLRSNG